MQKITDQKELDSIKTLKNPAKYLYLLQRSYTDTTVLDDPMDKDPEGNTRAFLVQEEYGHPFGVRVENEPGEGIVDIPRWNKELDEKWDWGEKLEI